MTKTSNKFHFAQQHRNMDLAGIAYISQVEKWFFTKRWWLSCTLAVLKGHRDPHFSTNKSIWESARSRLSLAWSISIPSVRRQPPSKDWNSLLITVDILWPVICTHSWILKTNYFPSLFYHFTCEVSRLRGYVWFCPRSYIYLVEYLMFGYHLYFPFNNCLFRCYALFLGDIDIYFLTHFLVFLFPKW